MNNAGSKPKTILPPQVWVIIFSYIVALNEGTRGAMPPAEVRAGADRFEISMNPTCDRIRVVVDPMVASRSQIEGAILRAAQAGNTVVVEARDDMTPEQILEVAEMQKGAIADATTEIQSLSAKLEALPQRFTLDFPVALFAAPGYAVAPQEVAYQCPAILSVPPTETPSTDGSPTTPDQTPSNTMDEPTPTTSEPTLPVTSEPLSNIEPSTPSSEMETPPLPQSSGSSPTPTTPEDAPTSNSSDPVEPQQPPIPGGFDPADDIEPPAPSESPSGE